MTEEQYITALKNNPLWCTQYLPNPTEGMQLVCVKQNGMLLQYIKNPTDRVIESVSTVATGHSICGQSKVTNY